MAVSRRTAWYSGASRQAPPFSIQGVLEILRLREWWPLVDAETRGWLIEHNGEPLPPHVIADIMAVTRGTTDSEWWAGESADGPQLSDEAADWIEAVANDEEPTAG